MLSATAAITGSSLVPRAIASKNSPRNAVSRSSSVPVIGTDRSTLSGSSTMSSARRHSAYTAYTSRRCLFGRSSAPQ